MRKKIAILLLFFTILRSIPLATANAAESPIANLGSLRTYISNWIQNILFNGREIILSANKLNLKDSQIRFIGDCFFRLTSTPSPVLLISNFLSPHPNPTLTPEPSQSPLPKHSSSPTPTVSPSISPSPSVSPSISPLPTPLPTPTPYHTPIPTPTTTPIPSATPTPLTLSWGAYVGDNTSDAVSFESLVGQTMNLQAVFTGWGSENTFPSEFGPTVRDKGKTLVVFWELTDGSSSLSQPNYNYDSITSGEWDSYITQFASDAQKYGGQVILAPFHEMNGNWDPWGGTVNGNSPEKFISAWRYVRDLFSSAANVKFAWDVNNESVPDTASNQIENYYPGDNYVDYPSVDGFNFGDPWQSWGDVFSNALNHLIALSPNKPIYILSMACAQGSQKADWILTGLGTEIKKYPQVAGWIWFNENKEEDWRIDSDINSLNAFKSVVPYISVFPGPSVTPTPSPTCSPSPTPTLSPTPSSSVSQIESRIFDLINQYRFSNGLSALKFNSFVSDIAREHSLDMAQGAVSFGHDGFDNRVSAIRSQIGGTAFGENVAYNYGYGDPAQQAVNQWIASSGHRQNILGNFTTTGIGVAKSSNDSYYFTQIFVK